MDGIAEDEPIQIYFTKEFTTIPQHNRRPIAAKRWRHKEDSQPFRDLLKSGKFRYLLESEATSGEDVKLMVKHLRVVSGRIDKSYNIIIDDFTDFTYNVEAGKPVVWVHFGKLCEILERHGVKKNMNVSIDIAYVEK